jgi:hypothetical protein
MADNDTVKEADKPEGRTIVDSIEIAGSEVIGKVRELIKAGNVRTLHIHARESDFSLEMPVTVGVIVGGAVALTAPWLAMLGVVAGLVTKVRIDVERDEDAKPANPDDTPPAA